MTKDKFDCVVVGAGLIGSAAAKYLARYLDNVALIGPTEPLDWQSHNGVFASHYDSGRVTRILDGDRSLFWARVAKASIDRYREIEQESGIKFFSPAGCLKVAPADETGRDYIDAHIYSGQSLAVDFEKFASTELKTRFPFLCFPADSLMLQENHTAGWIDPRKLLQAQLKLSDNAGATIIDDTVVAISKPDNGTLKISLASDREVIAQKALVTAGAFSNFHNLLTRKLDIKIRAEAVVLGEISIETAEELSTMPSIVWAVERGVCGGIYIVPPVQYPDGKFYIKIGSRSNQRRYFSALEETITWFQGDGQTVTASENRRVLEEILPDTHFLSWQVKPCILTDTPSLKPYIGQVSNNLFVAIGGNGYGAKSSDELGRMGALTAMGRELDSIYADYDLGPC